MYCGDGKSPCKFDMMFASLEKLSVSSVVKKFSLISCWTKINPVLCNFQF